MKYIKEYNKYVDPFSEEDWEEVEIKTIILDWDKNKQDVPENVNKRIFDLGNGKLGISNLDYTKILTVEDGDFVIGYGNGENFPKYKLIDHNGKPNESIQYSIVKFNNFIYKKCPGYDYHLRTYNPNRKCPVFDANGFKLGELLFKYCDPDIPYISDGRNYHIVAGVESVNNASLYTYWWTENREYTYWGGTYLPDKDVGDDWGANDYFKIVKK